MSFHSPDLGEEKKEGRFFGVFERLVDGMLRTYDWTLKIVLRYRVATMIVTGQEIVSRSKPQGCDTAP